MRWLFAILVTMGLAAAAAPALAECTCPTASKSGGWCDDCGLGYIKHAHQPGDPAKALASDASVKLESVKCRDCYEAASAVQGGYCATHGVGYVNGAKTKCTGCVAAAQGENDGWCKTCNLGYAKGQKTSCKECLKAIKDDDGGWCDECKTGYDQGLKTQCKDCFDQMTKDDGGWCDKCGIGYADGHQTKCKSCYAAMTKDDGGWCDTCQTGYHGATQTWCRSCFAAMQKDGRCEVCKVDFKDGQVCRKLQFAVVGLDVKDRADDVEDALEKLAGADDVKVDKGKGTITLVLCDGPKSNSHDAYVVVRKCGCEVKSAKTG